MTVHIKKCNDTVDKKMISQNYESSEVIGILGTSISSITSSYVFITTTNLLSFVYIWH